MCFEEDYPQKETLESAEQMNGDGAGMAWIEQGKVHYKKGVKTSEILKVIDKRKIKLPIIIHYRIATVGKVCKELTHPFPIEEGVPLKDEGVTENGVLFHNGNWSEWREWCAKTITRKQIQFPRGIWSDSRAMAFLAHHYGIGFLNLISANKIAVMTPTGIEKFGNNWVNVDKAICSNDTFDNKVMTFSNTGDEYDEYYHGGNWQRPRRGHETSDSETSVIIDGAVEEEIEKHLKNASEEELKKDVEITDQIVRNKIREGLNKRTTEIERTAIKSYNKEEKEEPNLTMDEYIKKYDGVDDEVIMEEFYKHSKFRKKYDHPEEVIAEKRETQQLSPPVREFYGIS